MKALGIHVFAGGFTLGVKKVFPVVCQLETHGFGRESCEEVADVPFVNDPNANWPAYDVDFIYGNPRCTAFSTMTSGYDENTHGAFAKQTIDIHQFCEYAVQHSQIAVWESVQQAFTTGRPLLDYLRDEIFVPAGFRVAHVLLNAASFGNSQNRKRYFFVAYRRGRNFNIQPPEISPYYSTLYDAIWPLRNRETNRANTAKEPYNFDTHHDLGADNYHCLPNLANGWSLNHMAKHRLEMMPERFQLLWNTRASDMPFSLHCPRRLQWMRPAPTLHGSCDKFVHPDYDRGLTVGEAATIMGWEGLYPRGPRPFAQLAKGVAPAAGEWLAQQALLYLQDAWADEDWESSYCHQSGRWEGRDTHGENEKVFNLTRYYGHQFDQERFDESVHLPTYR